MRRPYKGQNESDYKKEKENGEVDEKQDKKDCKVERQDGEKQRKEYGLKDYYEFSTD